MTIEKILRSAEECQQAGWQGYDIHFDGPVSREQILLWQSLGDLVYLSQLRQPFYRITGRSFLIKGLEGQTKLRIGFTAGFLDCADPDAVRQFLLLK